MSTSRRSSGPDAGGNPGYGRSSLVLSAFAGAALGAAGLGGGCSIKRIAAASDCGRSDCCASHACRALEPGTADLLMRA